MATDTILPAQTEHKVIPYHVYHAEAHIIKGQLEHPVKQEFEFEGHVAVEHTRREAHVSRSIGANTLEGLISFKAAYTRASGNKFEKMTLQKQKRKGWVTLSTSIIEGLNVFEVLTADRVVAQVSTEHPDTDDPDDRGHVPHVTFLGTRFENLQISGHPVTVHYRYDICGERPKSDTPYLAEESFLNDTYNQAASTLKGLPPLLGDKYEAIRDNIAALKEGLPDRGGEVTCSIVKSIDPIPELKVTTFGNVMVIPNFGSVALGELRVKAKPFEDPLNRFGLSSNGHGAKKEWSSYFHLDMLQIALGCIGKGTVTAATATTNGVTRP